eukprot:COSAG06_NODE_8749_length_2079_cov_114.974747_2_plen_54_part_01
MLSVLRLLFLCFRYAAHACKPVFCFLCVREMVLREAVYTDCDVVAVWVCGAGAN